MQSIIITPERIKKELIYLIIAFAISNMMNAYAIYAYKTNWIELFTYLPIVIILSLIFYFLIVGIRAIYGGIGKTVKWIKAR